MQKLFTTILFLFTAICLHGQMYGDIIFVDSICKSDIRLDDATKNKPRPDIAVLAFESTSNTKYALDQYQEVYAKVTEFFLKYKPTDEDMIASAKFMPAGASDEIFVKVIKAENTFNPEKVKFVTDKGKEYTGKYDENKKGWTITLLGSDANDGQNLFVVQEETPNNFATLARLNIFSYEPKTIKVRLVPVNNFTNGFSANAVSQELNAIYNKVGITCDVSMADNFEYDYALHDNTYKIVEYECHNPYTFRLMQGSTEIARKTTTDIETYVTFTASDGVMEGKTYTVIAEGRGGWKYTTNATTVPASAGQLPFPLRINYYTHDNDWWYGTRGTNYNVCDLLRRIRQNYIYIRIKITGNEK